MPKIKITLVRSVIATTPNHKKVVKALGLGKLNSSVVQQDNPAIRGMVFKVRHLVKVEPVTEVSQ
jgi:large subunit ribosomal protein L30